jgi:hypothetical protein
LFEPSAARIASAQRIDLAIDWVSRLQNQPFAGKPIITRQLGVFATFIGRVAVNT